jgi:hypothetical protein
MTQTTMSRIRTLTIVQVLQGTVYYYSTEQDKQYALIKYNNYLYLMQLTFTLLAKNTITLNETENYNFVIAISMEKVSI